MDDDGAVLTITADNIASIGLMLGVLYLGALLSTQVFRAVSRRQAIRKTPRTAGQGPISG